VIRDYERETRERVAWIKSVLADAGVGGIVFGSSGGKDSVLVGVLCKMACDDTLGVIMPCEASRNFGQDKDDALLLLEHFCIEHMEVDLTAAKRELVAAIGLPLGKTADINIAPRLRMTALYAIGAQRGALVAGTSNRSERHMGYFTKWGDGASDFNPIADLTVTEVFEFLKHLAVPEVFYTKAPSAGLYEGQTDEADMGVTYGEIDRYLLLGEKGPNYEKIERANKLTAHKRLALRQFAE